MTIRLAEIRDLPELNRIYDSARQHMRRNGNPTQWADDYPSAALLENDIGNQQLYVIEENGVHGVFVLANGPDPTYLRIDGDWLSDSPYMVIHRIASDGVCSGVLASAIQLAKERTGSLRIDTHENNRTMRQLLSRFGFTYCGIICLENGEERLAFQIDF